MALITPLMPGAGPPPTRMPTLFLRSEFEFAMIDPS
jgi:hypothetical protein